MITNLVYSLSIWGRHKNEKIVVTFLAYSISCDRQVLFIKKKFGLFLWCFDTQLATAKICYWSPWAGYWFNKFNKFKQTNHTKTYSSIGLHCLHNDEWNLLTSNGISMNNKNRKLPVFKGFPSENRLQHDMTPLPVEINNTNNVMTSRIAEKRIKGLQKLMHWYKRDKITLLILKGK